MKIFKKTLKYFAISMCILTLTLPVQVSLGWLPSPGSIGLLSLAVLWGSWFAAKEFCKLENAERLELFRRRLAGLARENLLKEQAAVDEEFKTILKYKADIDEQCKACQDILESGQYSNEVLERIKELTKQKEDFDQEFAVALRQKTEIDEKIRNMNID